MPNISRCLGREQSKSIGDGGETWSCCRSRYTTTGPGWKFDGSPEPKRTKTTSVTDNENLAGRMDEDNFQWTPATSHPLEPVDDENVSKKARVARNVLHLRGENNAKIDVNEEAWPNADLAIHSTYEGALIDGLPPTKSRLAMNEKPSG